MVFVNISLFTAELKALFKNNKYHVNVEKERRRVAEIRECLRSYPLCTDKCIRDITHYEGVEDALIQLRIELLQLQFSINYKLYNSCSKIDRILYWFARQDKLDSPHLINHPVCASNLPYVSYRIQQIRVIMKKYIKEYKPDIKIRKRVIPGNFRLNVRAQRKIDYYVLNVEESDTDSSSDDEDEDILDLFKAVYIQNARNDAKQRLQQRKRQKTLEGVPNYDVQLPYQPPIVTRHCDLHGIYRERLTALACLRASGAIGTFKYYYNVIRCKKDYYLDAWYHYNINEGYTEYEMLCKDFCVEALPEMDTAGAHGEDNLNQNQASNVVLTESREESRECTSEFQVQTWKDMCSSEFAPNYALNVDRWILIDTFEWNTSQTQSALLQKYQLPYQMVKKENITPCRMPNTLPFTIHRYWRGDLEVKIHINANKFQIGSLQCSWYYSPDFDAKIGERMNIWTQSQTHHTIINAATSNEVSMIIPYKYHLPYLHTKPRDDMPSPPLNLGTLYIRVLNPLTTSVSGPTRANVSVFIRSFNNEFTGMIAGDLDKIETVADPEMDRLIETGIGVLNMLHPDQNRDNPPNIRAPSMFVPMGSHSWCVGTGLDEPLHPMRLDARGQTPHPPGIEVNGEMEINNVIRKFSFVKTIEWTKNANKGEIIFQADVSPFSKELAHYWPPTSDSRVGTYAITPVGIISNMFYGWRGTIEYRFDVVASQFHTGRLLVGFVPGVTNSSNVTFAHLRASTNMVFSLQEADQFVFKVPYICNKPYWPREYAGDYDKQNMGAPSRIFMGVLNQLIPMESVSDKVFINMYMRAGEDFEIMVPVQPSIGLCYNPNFVVNSDEKTEIIATSGYAPYYIGSFEDFTDAMVFRWGAAAHQIAHFNDYNRTDGVKYKYCALQGAADANLTYYNGQIMVPCEFAVFLKLEQLGYYCGIPSPTETTAEKLAYNIQILKKALNDPSNRDLVISNKLTTKNNTYCKGNPVWTVTTKTVKPLEAEYEGERDEVQALIDVGNIRSTLQGLSIYGERFFSLKDICRRYQLYGVFNVTQFTTQTQEFVKIRFPVVPQGLELALGTKSNINEVFNRCREGHIPIIASGYRFYRGSVRFRIICNPRVASLMVVQHRPDRRLRSLKIESGDADNVVGDNVMNHTYASYIQLTRINGIVEFEVPFYQLGMYGLLQYPRLDENSDASNYYSLGEIAININANVSELANIKNCLMTVYYSIGDDMAFSTFQGFPPMILLSEIPDGSQKNTSEQSALPEMMPPVEVNPEGIFDSIKNQFSGIVTTSIENSIKDAVSTEMQKLDPIKKEILDKLEVNVSDSIVKIICSSLHLTQSTTIATMCLVIVNILLELKFIVVDNIIGISNTLISAVKSWLSRSSSEVLLDASNVPHVNPESLVGTFDSKDWGPFVGMLFSGISSAMALTVAPPKDMNVFTSFIIKQIPQIARNFTFISVFVNSIIDLSKRMVRWILHKVYPQETWYIDLRDDAGELKEWVDEVLYLCSIDIVNRLDIDGYLFDRVYSCMLYGREMAARYCETSDPKIHLFLKVYDKINDLYWKMEAAGKHPFVRKEPFCLWMYGAPGIGKSFVTEHLSSHLLKHVNYQLTGPKMYTVMPSNEFWSGCKNQPVLCMDDAFAIETGPTLERQLNTMYMVKSPVILNPPMADLKDKHLRYNPEIFYINSNKAFLNIAGLDPAAIHRRRDVLIEARIKNSKKISDFTRAELGNFEHLEFRLHRDPAKPDTSDGMWCNWISFEVLVQELKIKYKKFYDIEKQNYLDRLATYNDIESGQSEAQMRDDNNHIYSVKELASQRHHMAIDQFRRDYDRCVYNVCKKFCTTQWEKMYDWMNDLNVVNKISKYVNPMIVRVSTVEAISEMDRESTSTDYTDVDNEPEIISQWNRDIPFWSKLGDTISISDEPNYIFDSIVAVADKYILKKDDTIRWKKYFQQSMEPWCWTPTFLNHIIIVFKAFEYDKYYFYNKPYMFWTIVREAFIDYVNASNNTDDHASVYTNCVHMRVQHSPRMFKYVPMDPSEPNGPHYFVDVDGISIKCPKCILSIPFFAYIWYDAWLYNNTKSLYLYKRGECAGLPLYFQQSPNGLDVKKELDEYFASTAGKIIGWCQHKLPTMALKVIGWVATAGIMVAVACSIIWGIKTVAGLFGVKLSDDMAGAIGTVISPKFPQQAVQDIFAISEGSYTIPNKIIKRPEVKIVTKNYEMNQVQYQNTITALNRNTVVFTAEYINSRGTLAKITARCLALSANRILALRHYHDEFLALPTTTRYYVNIVINNVLQPRVEIDYRNLRTDAFYCLNPKYGTNFFIIYAPASIPLFKNILNLIPTQEEHNRCGRIGHLYSFGDTTYSDIVFSYHGEYRIRDLGNSKGMLCMNAYAYNKHKPGMCGSILISEAMGNACIIGMHVAGADGTGFAEPLYREMFEMLPSQVIKDVELPKIVEAKPEITLDTVVFIEGTCDPKHKHVETGKSAIIQSEIAGVFPVTYSPNPLSPKDKRLPPGSNPMKDGCEKHGMPFRPLNGVKLELVWRDLADKFIQTVKPIRQTVGVLPLEVAVCGDPDMEYYERLEFNTSPGFGYADVRRGSGKKFLFDLEETERGYKLLGIHERLREIMEHKENLRKNGILPNTVFVDCLKDTTIPKEKCSIPGKTRIFSISPVDFTIQFKQYFGDFLAAYTKARFRAEHAIGINVDSEEWTGLYNHLQLNGYTFITGDYSNYGPGLSMEVANAAMNIIVMWYKHHGATTEHLHMLEVMRHEILASRHLCMNVFYSVCAGIPSGSPITAPLNSIANSIYLRMMWLDIMENDYEFSSLESFNANVRVVTYGDDVIATVKERVRDRYNIATLSEAFAEYGIKFTDARKTGVIVPYIIDIHEVWFLSRCFVPHPKRLGLWLAGLKKESIENTANWIRKKNTCRRDATLVNARMAIELSYGWGPEYYDFVKHKILTAVGEKLDECISVKQWEERDREIFDMKIASMCFIPILDF